MGIKLHWYSVGVRGAEWTKQVLAPSAGKAKYDYFLDVRDAWPDVKITDMTAKAMDLPKPSDDLRQIAKQRGLPFLKEGMKAICNGDSGVVAGASSGYVVLVNEKGQRLTCHPHWRMTYFNDDGSIAWQFKEIQQ